MMTAAPPHVDSDPSTIDLVRPRRVRPGAGAIAGTLSFASHDALGLADHPDVRAARRRTPRATVRAVAALEERVASFHGRAGSLVLASPGAGRMIARLEQLLVAGLEDGGRLVVAEGVFRNHGAVAPLPELRALADRFSARLLVDETHSAGVIGTTGRGLEEAFGMPGAADLIVGRFISEPGIHAGYVAGSPATIAALRAAAGPTLSASVLPATGMLALAEAFRVMMEDPEPRERLWRQACRFWAALRDQGVPVAALESPIVPVLVQDEQQLDVSCRALARAGIRCGAVRPAAANGGEPFLRFRLNARHTDADIERTAGVLGGLWRDGRSVRS